MTQGLDIRKRMLTVFMTAVLVVGAACHAASPARGAAAGDDAVEAVIARHARDLHQQLQRRYAETPGLGRRIAIWPYGPDERLPISHDQARFLNDRLQHALQAVGKGAYDFKGRRELRAVIRDLAESGDLGDDPIAVVKRHAAADILIVGRIAIVGERLVSNFRAVMLRDGWTGSIIATTKTRALPLRFVGTRVQLAQFVEHAAKALVAGAPDMTELHQAGMKFQDTGQQPPFGSYLERMLAGEIATTVARSGRRLVVRRAELDRGRLGALRGKKVAAKKLDARHFDSRAGVYVLSGTYWDLGDRIDVELRLNDAKGASLSYRGSIVRSSVGVGLALRPTTNLEALRREVLRGPVRLQLTSARGKDPVYRIHDDLDLLIRVSRDAWLYCFYLQSDGKLLKIYPNGYGEPRAFAAGRLHTLPGRIFPFEMTFTEPPGVELVKCFAAESDLTDRLPPPLRHPEATVLPADMARGLRDAFAGQAEVSEASLVITVER